MTRKRKVMPSVHQTLRIKGARLPTERVRDANFARQLSQLMAKRELNQSQLAFKIWKERKPDKKGKLTIVGRDRISVWVNGHNFPNRENLQKLAEELEVKVSELAPEAELKAAFSVPADWSFTKPHGEANVTFFQCACCHLPDEIAHEIIGLMIKADQRPPS